MSCDLISRLVVGSQTRGKFFNLLWQFEITQITSSLSLLYLSQDPSCHWVRGSLQLGQVYRKADIKTQTHSHPSSWAMKSHQITHACLWTVEGSQSILAGSFLLWGDTAYYLQNKFGFSETPWEFSMFHHFSEEWIRNTAWISLTEESVGVLGLKNIFLWDVLSLRIVKTYSDYVEIKTKFYGLYFSCGKHIIRDSFLLVFTVGWLCTTERIISHQFIWSWNKWL